MQKYELTVVLPGKTSAAKKKAFVEKLEKTVDAMEGKLGKLEDWGEKPLAYEIKKNEVGNYLHFPLELISTKAGQIDAKLKVDDEVLRYLLVRVEK